MSDEGEDRPPVERPSARRRRRVAAAESLAHDQHGVLSRRQLRELGVTRHLVRTQVDARRWRAHWLQTVAVHTAELTERAR